MLKYEIGFANSGRGNSIFTRVLPNAPTLPVVTTADTIPYSTTARAVMPETQATSLYIRFDFSSNIYVCGSSKSLPPILSVKTLGEPETRRVRKMKKGNSMYGEKRFEGRTNSVTSKKTPEAQVIQ